MPLSKNKMEQVEETGECLQKNADGFRKVEKKGGGSRGVVE